MTGGYIRRSDAERLLNDCTWGKSRRESLDELMRIPSAVVSCGECFHCIKMDEYELWCGGRGHPIQLVRADEFCSRGKRRKDG